VQIGVQIFKKPTPKEKNTSVFASVLKGF